MAIQYSTTVRNAVLDQVETTIGTSPKLRIYGGTKPANPGTADGNTAVVEIALPSDWMANASSGSKSMSGTWSATATAATSNATHYRIYDSAGTTCHEQGDVGATGSGADMEIQNTNIAVGQTVTVTTFTRTAPNA